MQTKTQNIAVLIRNTAIASLLTLGLMGTAPAKAQTFYAQASGTVSNVPGATSKSALSPAGSMDLSMTVHPAGATYNNGYGLVYSEAAISANSSSAGLSAYAMATATRISATAFNGSPNGSVSVWSKDVLTVKSATLPVGTPVTLVFDNQVTASIVGTGNYTGSYTATFSVAGQTSTTRNWEGVYYQFPPMTGKLLTVNTKVGARLYMESSLSARTIADHFQPGPKYSGQAETSVQAHVRVNVLTVGASVVSDSGIQY